MHELTTTSRRALCLGLASLACIPRGARAASPSLLGDFGPAPEFEGIERWLNSPPLTMRGLAGKVVLVDFWTYGCYNCVNTIPHVLRWHQQFKDRGLVIVGVHTPEFPFERSTANVEAALDRHGIRFPVAQDNRFATWQAYSNRYWPAFYLVDKQGRVRRRQFGEGQYREMEEAIQALL